MPKYIKGLNKDTGHVDQIEGTYRHAKNAILNDRAGSIQNEHGTSTHVVFPTHPYIGWEDHSIIPDTVTESGAVTVIGTIEITDDRVIAFAVTDVSSYIYIIENKQASINEVLSNGPIASILLHTWNGDVQEIDDELVTSPLSDVDLKFNKNFPIEGTYKIVAGGSLVIYWTDNNSPPRSFNVSKQQKFNVTPNVNGTDAWHHPNTVYGQFGTESNNINYIDRLNLFPHAGPVPSIKFKNVKNGGALKSGIYYLFLAYADSENTQTNYITSSLPVPIVEDSESVLPIERYDGAPADSQTGKLITWDITNLNKDYEYLRPVVVSRINNIELAYRLNDIDITNKTQTTVSFSMLEGYASADPAEVVIDAVSYDTAKTLTQLDSVLYVGNVTGTKDVGYQKYANFIKLEPVVETWDNFDPFSLNSDNLDNGFFEEDAFNAFKTSGYRDLNNMINKRGYMRDEVYAFYISFILNDGSMSYSYHIPGRQKLTDKHASNFYNIGSTAKWNSDLIDVVEGGPNTSSWDEDDVITNGIDSDLHLLSGGDGKLFHFYDFSKFADSKNMSYWENLNEFYPDTSDYTVVDAENGVVEDDELKTTPVRHHHFPSNDNPDFSVIDHEASIPQIDGDPILVATHYYFTFTDIENVTGGGNLSRIIVSQSDLSSDMVNGTGDYTGDSGTTGGAENDLGNYFTDMTGPGGAYENASHSLPNSTIAVGQFMYGYTQCLGSLCGSADTFAAEFVTMDGAEVHIESNTSGIQTFTKHGFILWTEYADIYATNSIVSQVVRPMGFQLSDIKIPLDIANKVQGFRIYYARRDHNNRRILGQDHIKETSLEEDKDIGACDDSLTSTDAKEDFLVPYGSITQDSSSVTTGAFHDFYLLNPGYGLISQGLSTATHVNKLYDVKFHSFKGPGNDYHDIVADVEGACTQPYSSTSFHIGHESHAAAGANMHFPIREKCRTYVNGDSIYDGRSLGFGKRINNIGGEKYVALGFTPSRALPLEEFPAFPAAEWAEVGGSGVPAELIENGGESDDAVELSLYNLCAFKTDMYQSIDTQQLVWTGYEVLGDKLDNFIVTPEAKQSRGLDDVPFETTPIFGGDTFICRHGYRMTSREEWFGAKAKDVKSVISTICESTDNINLRHEESDASAYFPGAPLKRVLAVKADVNLTDSANLKYNSDYSLGNKDHKFPPVLPLRDVSPLKFPNRVQRSAKADDGSIIDNYRVFLSSEIKDLPRNRGDLWNLISFNNLLYMHMQDSLFRTKGKQSMQMSDGSDAYLGSGDIFVQAPDEVVQTESGYGGTQSQWASLVTPQGYFSLDYRNRKVYMVTDKFTDIGAAGLAKWFTDNIPYGLENYGIGDFDNPIVGVGFHAVWDEKYKRILLTKRDLVPTAAFITNYSNQSIQFNKVIGQYEIDNASNPGSRATSIEWGNSNYFTKSGWTISYSPATSSWVSFHDYIPYIYSYDKEHMLSMQDGGSEAEQNIFYEHVETNDVGLFYNMLYPFEFEFVFNKAKDEDKVFYNFEYTADVYTSEKVVLHNQGFDSFFVYTTHQLSGEEPLEYLINTRRVGNEWKVNKFRDIATLITNTDAYYIGPHGGSNYGVPGANVAGSFTTEVVTTQEINMFTVSGMNKTINTSFINSSKSWNRRRKFIDKWVGIRLIYSNSTKNLIYLYATDVAAKSFVR
tara:strand:- start:2222 stop:7234 length:5013 start_codon:yes stop_codon:yes gene_type:complete